MDTRASNSPQSAYAREARCGGLRHAISARKWWLIGMVFAALSLLSAVCSMQPPRFNAEAQVQTGPRLGGVIGLRASAANLNAAGGIGTAIGKARLLASRGLARRVIKELGIEEYREFDPAANGLGLASRALVFLGIKRDPARVSRDDRVLEAFQERLRVSGPDRQGLLTIAFQAENSELAASAANRLAELYIDMHMDVQKAQPRQAGARIVAFADAPLYPVRVDRLPLLAGMALAVIAFGAFVTIALPRFSLRERRDEAGVEPHPVGCARAIARIKVSERLSPRLTPSLDPPLPITDARAGENPEGGQLIAKVAKRIVSERARVRRCIRILATQPLAGNAEPFLLLAFARELARGGRAIAICLDSASFLNFGGQAMAPNFKAVPGAGSLLGDLIAGRVLFTEVICRDPASRLHMLPVGQSDDLDLHELENIVDALAETYDFTLIISSPIDQVDTAKYVAAKSDFVLLASPVSADGSVVAAEWQLIESGAAEILLIGPETDVGQSLARNAA